MTEQGAGRPALAKVCNQPWNTFYVPAEYRYQVEEDIKPFRDVLLGLFFVTVGMFLDVRVVAAHWLYVLVLLVLPVLAKLVLAVILSRAFGQPLGTALRTGFSATSVAAAPTFAPSSTYEDS